jgi:hypothetical protein
MSEDETGLDAVSPETHPARSAEHFRRIISARKAVAHAELELHAAVAAAREVGDSWSVIGAALNTTQEAAAEQFGKAELETKQGDAPDPVEVLESARKASAIVMADAAKGRSRRKGKPS